MHFSSVKKCAFLVCFLFCTIFHLANCLPTIVQDSEVEAFYTDEKVAQLITVITTTNPIPSIPRLDHIYQSQVALHRIPAFAQCKKIIVFDGIQPNFENRRADYEEYKKRIEQLTQTDPFFANTQLIYCPLWSHISGAIKEAIKYVETPFVFIHQHDFLLVKNFDLNRLIATMVANPSIKHVRLGFGRSGIDHTEFYGPQDEKISLASGPLYVPLSRCFGWSDNDHISPTSYYRDFVLPGCGFGAMEWFMHNNLRKRSVDLGVFTNPYTDEIENWHSHYGTYSYGHLGDGNYIYHTDGQLSP